jgi:hypothetical protein
MRPSPTAAAAFGSLGSVFSPSTSGGVGASGVDTVTDYNNHFTDRYILLQTTTTTSQTVTTTASQTVTDCYNNHFTYKLAPNSS